MAQELMNTVSPPIIPARNEQSQVAKERQKVIKRFGCIKEQIEDFEVLKF